MALQHVNLLIHGVQFHPESVSTAHGHRMLVNWLRIIGADIAEDRVLQLEQEMAHALN